MRASLHGNPDTAAVVPVQVLQPLQSASFAVQAYPFTPDMLAVLGILAEEAGDPPMMQPSTAYNTP